MKLDINNYKSMKMFNNCYARACHHHKRRVRKKNYKRAQNMLYASIIIDKIMPTKRYLKLVFGNNKMKWLQWLVN